jgi:hypothetical protein
MPFPKKSKGDAEFASFNQQNVSELATRALQKQLATRVNLALRVTMQTPLLVQRWTTKAVRKMLGNMVGMPEPREAKDLTKDFDESWYRNTKGKAVMPCRILKAALVEGAISTGKTVSKAELNRGLRVLGYTSPLNVPQGDGDNEIHMDVKIVRNAGGQPDVRARAQFPVGTYFDAVLSFGLPLTPDKVMAAALAAGQTIGLCEWRPAKGGDLGTFSIEVLDGGEKTVQRILKECDIPEDEFILPPEMLRAFQAIPQEKLNDSQRKVRALTDHVAGQQNGESTEEAKPAPKRGRARANGATAAGS